MNFGTPGWSQLFSKRGPPLIRPVGWLLVGYASVMFIAEVHLVYIVVKAGLIYQTINLVIKLDFLVLLVKC